MRCFSSMARVRVPISDTSRNHVDCHRFERCEDFLSFNGTNVFLYPEGRSTDFSATVTVKTECAHCKTPMELTIDSDLKYVTKNADCDPLAFIPSSKTISDVPHWLPIILGQALNLPALSLPSPNNGIPHHAGRRLHAGECSP